MNPLLPLSLRFDPAANTAPPGPLSPSIEFNERLTSLYALAQRSTHVFASPLGPFSWRARHVHVPRFVYFGPHTSDESLRLAFYAGFDARDLRGTLALFHLIEGLALAPDLGQGLNLSFFPLVDATGLMSNHETSLAGHSWIAPASGELALLASDVRHGAYQGFVRLESTPNDDDVVTVRLRGAHVAAAGVELLDSDDLAPWSVRWEAAPLEDTPVAGPLSLNDDLPFPPFELTVGLPAAWSPEQHQSAATTILKRFIVRYRGLHAYGQHI